MSARTVRLGLLVVAALMLAIAAQNLSFTTDITHFLPSGGSHELADLSRALARSSVGRTMVLSVGPAAGAPVDRRASLDAAEALAEALRGHAAVREVRIGVDPGLQRQVYELYFPRRHLFLSDRPEQEIPQLVSESGLRERAETLRARLALPTGALLEQVAPADPLGGFERILERVAAARGGMRIDRGRFVSSDGEAAILMLSTEASGFDSAVQGPLLDDIAAAWATLAADRPGLALESSGVNRFAVSAERSIQRDIVRIGIASALGVTLLFLGFMRSVRAFGLALLPGALGILAAASGGVLLLGGLDGLTLAFGISLVGVAIDYSIHLMNHFAHAGPDQTAWDVARRLRPSLTLGALTTMASFAGLGLTSMRAFREIAFVSVVGVGVALLATLFALPALLEHRREPTRMASRTGAALGAFVDRLGGHRRLLTAVLVSAAVGAALTLPTLRWNDDLRALSAIDPALEAEDRRVRARISPYDPGRAVIAVADDAEGALALNDRVQARLAQATQRGEIQGAGSLHSFLWSADLQSRNWIQLAADPGLAARVSQVFGEAGFRAGVFEPFRAALDGEPPPPLTLDEALASPLGPLIRPQVLEIDDRTGIVTLVRGAASPDALAASVADIEGVHVLDQGAFANDVYRAFRARTLRQAGMGALLVIAVLILRYRRLRPALAAFLPAALVAAVLLATFALLDIEATLIHAVSLLLVMGMGVDYGIFLVDSADDEDAFRATLLSLLLSCLTTVFVFGTLALSEQPALRAMGLTTGLGILLSFLFAPLALLAVGGRR